MLLSTRVIAGRRFPFYRPRLPSLANGLIAWWPFGNGAAAEQSGHPSSVGILNGPPNPGTGPSAYVNALVFPGSNSYYVDGGSAANSYLGGASQATIACWVKPSVTSRGDIFTKWLNGNTAGDQFNLLQGVTSAKFQFFVSSGSGSSNTSASAATITVGTWYHLVAVFNNTDLLLYVNGVFDSSTLGSSISTLGNGTTNSYKIARNSSTDGPYSGSVADCRLYNRAFSPVEAFALYAEAFQSPLPISSEAIALMRKVAAAAPSGVKFRKTFSGVGGRVGTRQVIDWQ